VLLKVFHPLKIYQHTKFQGLMLAGASFTSTSEICTSAILELRYGIKNYGIEVTLNGMTSPLKMHQLVQKLSAGTATQTGR
jgi:hypothetical protein